MGSADPILILVDILSNRDRYNGRLRFRYDLKGFVSHIFELLHVELSNMMRRLRGLNKVLLRSIDTAVRAINTQLRR